MIYLALAIAMASGVVLTVEMIIAWQVYKILEELIGLEFEVRSLDHRMKRLFEPITAYDVYDNMKWKDMEDDGR